jgi:hypothetical protein
MQIRPRCVSEVANNCSNIAAAESHISNHEGLIETNETWSRTGRRQEFVQLQALELADMLGQCHREAAATALRLSFRVRVVS